ALKRSGFKSTSVARAPQCWSMIHQRLGMATPVVALQGYSRVRQRLRSKLSLEKRLASHKVATIGSFSGSMRTTRRPIFNSRCATKMEQHPWLAAQWIGISSTGSEQDRGTIQMAQSLT